VDCVSDVRQFISELKGDVDDILGAFQGDRIHMAKETKTRLTQFVSGLNSDVEEMLGGFQSDRADMTKETSAALLDCLSNTKRFVADLKDDVFAMQAGFSRTRMERARDDKKERERFAVDLLHEVSRLREGIQALRRSFAEDFRGAGHVWRGDVPAGPSVTETPEPRPMKAPKPPIEKKEKKAAKEIVPDDLTQIHGIGPGREARLKEAGIYTFADLAESPPETLRETLGGMGRLVDVENWIVAARKLARKSR
jgi:predicted flap endonuclease-1-like 5' DNA nuclease